jgi:hypothetical protein
MVSIGDKVQFKRHSLLGNELKRIGQIGIVKEVRNDPGQVGMTVDIAFGGAIELGVREHEIEPP